jgi:hypothetical protein
MVNLIRGWGFVGLCVDLACHVEIVGGIVEAVDLLAVARPLLDLVEIAIVLAQRIVGFFVRPVIHAC